MKNVFTGRDSPSGGSSDDFDMKNQQGHSDLSRNSVFSNKSQSPLQMSEDFSVPNSPIGQERKSKLFKAKIE